LIRVTLLTMAMATFTTAPFGCPTTDPGDGTQSPVRGTIVTSALAIDEATTMPAEDVIAGTPVSLRGSVSETDPEAVQYAWVQTGGYGVEIRDANAPVAMFDAPSLPEDGAVTIMLTTSNAAGDVGRAEVVVTVAADPNYQEYDFSDISGDTPPAAGPVANAGSSQTVLPGDEVTLDGTESTGVNLGYSWRQISGTTVTLSDTAAEQPTFTAPGYVADGENELVFELAVTDASNRTVTDRVLVRVRNPDASDRRVRVLTSRGEFVIELYPDEAPKSVENFLEYVDEGFYDGTIFHRVIADFVVQGGGFEPGLIKKDTRDPIEIESDNGLKNDRAMVAMARTSDPNSATSQWYVNVTDNDFLNYESPAEPGYTVFGEVVEGMSVVDRIATEPTESRQGFQDVPVDDILILSVTRE
jgi:cyclophilin family peptidyl-prolyl cis-trans isomerase